ncbi:hypothetical protein DPMN_140967 [Dreissena polymorpha]|uniref:Cytochrome P450 n=2 Tax=Dreissena polymorpha TaxID=45954 RepID=A0A9D4G933_DREPO|nr:hypothetical protein DPMN_140967 [Dreissena polymorpha]
MIPFIQDCVTSVLTDWKSRRDIVTYPECKQMAFRISACALIGIKPNEHKIGEMHEIFEDFTRSIFSIPVNFPGFGFRQALKAKKQLHAIIREVIADVQKGPSTPVMTAIFKSSEALGEDREESLIEVVVDLLFAGHETLASATTNSVMFLGQRKDVVKKLLDEIRHKLCYEQNDMVVDGYDCATDSLSFQKINELKYLNNVVNEVLRLLPPAGAGYRKVLKSFELGGFLIPKGWVVMYGIRDTHITSPVFENAADFDPDRWADIDASSSHGHNKARFQFLPFSYGARGCIGKTFAQLVLKIFIIELVQQCEWQLRNDRPKIRFAPMPVPADNLTIAVKPRTVK